MTVIHLPYTKLTQKEGRHDGEDIFWAAQVDDSDSSFTLQNYLSINNPQPGEHLFLYSIQSGIHHPLICHILKTHLIEALHLANCSLLKGHSFQIGGTLEYLLQSVSFEVIKFQGWWASDAFQLYLCNHVQVMALYVQPVTTLHEHFINLQYILEIPPVC